MFSVQWNPIDPCIVILYSIIMVIIIIIIVTAS